MSLITAVKPYIKAPYNFCKNQVLKLNRGEISNESTSIKENGFLYIVTGTAYAKECVMSIRSLKQHNDEKVCVFSEEEHRSLFEGECDYFFPIGSKVKRPKIDYIGQSPFENTVYLDSDTVIAENISEMFEMLEKFDFCGAFCNSRKRENYSKLIQKYGEIPYSFSEINTGVMVFNNSENTKELFGKWNQYYYEYLNKTDGWDQPSFRVALWESNVKIGYLPPEYNLRSVAVYEKVRKNKGILGDLHMEPRIYHMHYSAEVHQGVFNIKNHTELLDKIKKLSATVVH